MLEKLNISIAGGRRYDMEVPEDTDMNASRKIPESFWRLRSKRD
jgi:hypothetical protein